MSLLWKAVPFGEMQNTHCSSLAEHKPGASVLAGCIVRIRSRRCIGGIAKHACLLHMARVGKRRPWTASKLCTASLSPHRRAAAMASTCCGRSARRPWGQTAACSCTCRQAIAAIVDAVGQPGTPVNCSGPHSTVSRDATRLLSPSSPLPGCSPAGHWRRGHSRVYQRHATLCGPAVAGHGQAGRGRAVLWDKFSPHNPMPALQTPPKSFSLPALRPMQELAELSAWARSRARPLELGAVAAANHRLEVARLWQVRGLLFSGLPQPVACTLF